MSKLAQRMCDGGWAYDMVAKGVKSASILQAQFKSEEAALAYVEELRNSQHGMCYLDTVREPHLEGVQTGGRMLHPVMGVLPTHPGYTAFVAATESIADLLKWAFARIRESGLGRQDVDRAHVIVGLLCGYHPLAIDGFLKQR